MEIQTQQRGAVTIAKPMGPITGTDADVFSTRMGELIRQNLGRVAVDASALSYVDSSGLESLADAAKELAQGDQGRASIIVGHAEAGCRAERRVELITFDLGVLHIQPRVGVHDGHAAIVVAAAPIEEAAVDPDRGRSFDPYAIIPEYA